MKRIYIWGVGEKAEVIAKCVNPEKCTIVGYIDNNPAKQGTIFQDREVVSFAQMDKSFDYIVIAALRHAPIVYQIKNAGMNLEQVITFYDNDMWKNPNFIFDEVKRSVACLENQMNTFQKLTNSRIANMKYEIYDELSREDFWLPKIGSNEEAIQKMAMEGCSMIRFGDGDFEQMAGKERLVYQKYDPKLGERLKEIIQSHHEKLLIAIADNYGSLNKYTQDVADGIRHYMSDDVRKAHYQVLEKGRIYYDAYMFKGYMPYKDRENAKNRFDEIKKIWKDREVALIEGEYTRTGARNDLLCDAADVIRLLAPTKDAYNIYAEILEQALKIDKNKLILTVLGPTGKVLAYDLFLAGYQVVDIGQIDMDYDWYLAGTGFKVPNKYKYVSQLPEAEVCAVCDETYDKQIVARIGI